MPSNYADLGCMFCLAVVFMTMGGTLAFAAVGAFTNGSGLVGFLIMAFGAILLVTGVVSCLVASYDYIQNDRIKKVERLGFRYETALLHSLSDVYKQQAFRFLIVKVMFFCALFNFLGELYNLKLGRFDCHIIYVSKVTPECGTHTMGSDMFVTAILLGFFCTLFNFAEIQRGILGRLQTYVCTKKTVKPWIVAMHPKVLDRWYFRPFTTGNRVEIIRNRIWVRAILMSFNLMLVWEMPVFAVLALIAARSDWDGGMTRANFIIFKTIWSTMEGIMCTMVGFAAATSADAVMLTIERFGDPNKDNQENAEL